MFGAHFFFFFLAGTLLTDTVGCLEALFRIHIPFFTLDWALLPNYLLFTQRSPVPIPLWAYALLARTSSNQRDSHWQELARNGTSAVRSEYARMTSASTETPFISAVESMSLALAAFSLFSLLKYDTQ